MPGEGTPVPADKMTPTPTVSSMQTSGNATGAMTEYHQRHTMSLFQELASPSQPEDIKKNAIHSLFKEYDKDGSGLIDPEELTQLVV